MANGFLALEPTNGGKCFPHLFDSKQYRPTPVHRVIVLTIVSFVLLSVFVLRCTSIWFYFVLEHLAHLAYWITGRFELGLLVRASVERYPPMYYIIFANNRHFNVTSNGNKPYYRSKFRTTSRPNYRRLSGYLASSVVPK